MLLWKILLLVCVTIHITLANDSSYDVSIGVDFVKSLSKEKSVTGSDAASSALAVGVAAGGIRYRALLTFNLSNTAKELGKQAAGDKCVRVTRAWLQVHVVEKQLATSESFDHSPTEPHVNESRPYFPYRLHVSDVIQSWSKASVDWKHRYRAENGSRLTWSVPYLSANGLDARYPVTSYRDIGRSGSVPSQHSIDVTDSVRNWLADSSANHGILLWLWQDVLFMKARSVEFHPIALLTIASKDYADERKRPRLRIHIAGKTLKC